MAEAVYILCALTSLACAGLLIRGWIHGRQRLLLWSSLCFVGLALNNVLLFVDRVILPTTVDLSLYRTITAVFAVGLLLFGLIWDTAR